MATHSITHQTYIASCDDKMQKKLRKADNFNRLSAERFCIHENMEDITHFPADGDTTGGEWIYYNGCQSGETFQCKRSKKKCLRR